MPKWLASLLLLVALAAAQDTKPAEPTDSGLVLRFDVNLVQIDAVVTDSNGRRVADLTPEDFDIRQDGKPQQITHFSFIPEEEQLAEEQLESRPVLPPQLERHEVRRTVAILVDDFRMQFGDFVRTRRALRRFVAEELRPGDMVSVLRTALGSGALQQFSADRDYLEHVVSGLQWRPPIGNAAPLLYVLPQVLQAMADFPGRKTLIVVSPGLVARTTQIDRMMDSASRSSTVIHTVDVAGVQTFAIRAEDRRPATSFAAEFRDPSRRLWSSNTALNRQSILDSLAKTTGGLFFRGSNDLHRQVVDASRDSSGYYLIGWNPGPDAFERRAGRRVPYHRLRVRVNRKGVTVRTRRGFQAVPTPPNQPDRRSDAARMQDALFSPFKSGDIDVRLASSFQYDDASGPYLTSLLHVRPEGIDFEQDELGCQIANIEVLSTPLWLDQNTLVPSGTTSAQHAHMEVCGESARRMLVDGFAVELRSPVERPGGYQMRVAVRNIAPGERFSNAPRTLVRRENRFAQRPPLIGSATQVLDVPDWNKNRLAITGLVIGDADSSPPREGDATVRMLYPGADPAVREFRAGTSVPYAFRVVAAREKPPLDARLVLVHEGDVVATGDAMPVQAGESVQGAYPLDEALTTGAYLLGVEVTEQTGKKNPNFVQQWIDLEIH